MGPLDLETPGLPSSTTLLELPSVAANVRLLVLVGTEAKVPDGLPGILGTTEQDSVGSLGRSEGKLVEQQSLTTGGLDPLLGSLGESEGSDGELGQRGQSVVIGDGTNNNDGLGCLGALGNTAAVLGEVDQTRDRDGGSVDLAHKQSAEDDLVEARVGSSSQESVELVGQGDMVG